MKKVLLTIILLASATSPLMAQTHVKGYIRSDGTYVAPHVRSAPNRTTLDNYSTQGNVNPYTGQQGNVDPYPAYQPYRAPQPYHAPTYTAPTYGAPKVCAYGTYPC